MKDITAQNDRNIRCWGLDNQQKLNSSSAVIVGSGTIAQMVGAGLAGLGIGKISYIDNARIMRGQYDLLCHAQEDNKINVGKKKVYSISDITKLINRDIDVKPIFSKFTEALCYNSSKPDIIIESTNEPESKLKALKYSIDYAIPIVSASSNLGYSACSMHTPQKNRIDRKMQNVDLESIMMKEFDGLRQGSYTSGVISGIVIEEVRKSLFQMSDSDQNLSDGQKVIYNPLSRTKNSQSNDYMKNFSFRPKDKKVLVVGAGALGNSVILNLAFEGYGHIDIVDGDTVDATNLNRQFMFYGAVNENKAEVMKQRAKQINPGIQIDAYNRFISSGDKIFENKYDIVLGCLDNKEAREMLDDFAYSSNTSYIDGGTNPAGGQIGIYVPGKNMKVTEQMNFPEINRSCVAEPDPSVVMSNMIIGSAMVGETMLMLSTPDYCPNVRFTYKSTDMSRISTKRFL